MYNVDRVVSSLTRCCRRSTFLLPAHPIHGHVDCASALSAGHHATPYRLSLRCTGYDSACVIFYRIMNGRWYVRCADSL